MAILKIKLHQSLWIEGENHEFSGEVEQLTIIDSIKKILKDNPKVLSACLTSEFTKKPGILYISGKMEIASLGLLNQIMDEDIDLRIVPVLHGG